MIYTYTIISLMIISIILCIVTKKYDKTILIMSTIFFSIFSYLEFYFCNNYDVVPAWIFSENAITGIRLLTITIEDIVFSPVCAILFFFVWNYAKSKEYRIVSWYDSKILTIAIIGFLIIIGLYGYCFCGEFGKYQTYRYAIGCVSLLYVIRSVYKPTLLIVVSFVYLFAFLWDICALNTFQWVYKDYYTNACSKIWNGSSWALIYKAWFSTATFYYYFTGAIFFIGIIEAINKYVMNKRKKMRDNYLRNKKFDNYLQKLIDGGSKNAK